MPTSSVNEAEVRRRILFRWHNLKRKSQRHPSIRLCKRWFDNFERFLVDLQQLPGYDPVKIVNQELTLIRIGSPYFSPKTCMFVEGKLMTISGLHTFIVGHYKGKRTVVINEESFAKEKLKTTYHVLRRAATGRPHFASTKGWRFAPERFTRDTLAQALAAKEIYT